MKAVSLWRAALAITCLLAAASPAGGCGSGGDDHPPVSGSSGSGSGSSSGSASGSSSGGSSGSSSGGTGSSSGSDASTPTDGGMNDGPVSHYEAGVQDAVFVADDGVPEGGGGKFPDGPLPIGDDASDDGTGD